MISLRQGRRSRIDIDHVGLPSVTPVVGRNRLAQPLHVRQFLTIKFCPTFPFGDEAVKLGELNDAERALQIRHPVIETKLVERRKRYVAGRDGAALRNGGAVIAQISARAAIAGSFVTSIPPSPVVIDLRG